jgi:uncharacterized coiled-coil protein SlyX
MSKLARAWRWFCKYGWLIVSAAGLLLFWLFKWSRDSGRDWQGWRSEYGGVKTDVAKETKRREEEAQQAHQARIDEIEASHAETIRNLSATQTAEWKSLRKNPRKLARWFDRIADGG